MDATISGPGVPTSPGGARRGRYLFFVLASFGLLMASINHTMVAVALPSMTQSLDVSLAWVSWTLTASQLAMIVAMPVVGRLSDTFGRKQVFMFCVGSFTVGSLLSAVAPNVWTLIIFRAIQGIGAGGRWSPPRGGALPGYPPDRRPGAHRRPGAAAGRPQAGPAAPLRHPGAGALCFRHDRHHGCNDAGRERPG